MASHRLALKIICSIGCFLRVCVCVCVCVYRQLEVNFNSLKT